MKMVVVSDDDDDDVVDVWVGIKQLFSRNYYFLFPETRTRRQLRRQNGHGLMDLAVTERPPVLNLKLQFITASIIQWLFKHHRCLPIYTCKFSRIILDLLEYIYLALSTMYPVIFSRSNMSEHYWHFTHAYVDGSLRQSQTNKHVTLSSATIYGRMQAIDKNIRFPFFPNNAKSSCPGSVLPCKNTCQ